ncbi:MAG TPA: glycosyltransferase family 39 protein, partial [Vicinamibacterales bacterium]|nr:glycosyltransferase family 39 protein [Vicinamibacterales bacterium]
MRQSIIRILDSPLAVRCAMIVTLLLGYFFVFVWAPHPWSWQGIDAYHELAKALARGEPFPTTDVPWGYAYYAAFFYRLLGDRLWVPLFVQATLNAAVPWMLYHLVAPLAGRRTAVLSALLAGIFSFNTVYASTQSSDTICTVLFLAGLLALARGEREQTLWPFAVAGVLFGLVPQFRPNLVLLPGVIALAYLIIPPRVGRKLPQAAIFVALVVALQMPWIVRNYRLTGLFLPTSTHGGVQLWYGTLQVGPYLESRAHNPRAYFASPAFTYTSLSWQPLHLRAVLRNCTGDAGAATQLVYWTDRDPQHRALAPVRTAGAEAIYQVPAQPDPTAIYYYFEQRSSASAAFTTPIGGANNPSVAFVSSDHLGDLDRHDDVLDLFDLIRMLRHIAWQEPLRAAAKVDLNQDGRVDAADVDALVRLVLPEMVDRSSAPPSRVEPGSDRVTVHLGDGSWIAVPRAFSGRETDLSLSLHGEMAPALMSRPRPFTSLRFPRHPGPGGCLPADEIELNGPFYLGEPHGMRRYMALAQDNIARDPLAFVTAS